MAPLVAELLRNNNLCGKTFVETHAGSASISWHLLANKVADGIELIERDPLLYAFWACVFNNTEALTERILALDVTMDTWQKMQPWLSVSTPDNDRLLDLAVVGFFLNRTNFSGVLHAGPIGGMTQSSAYSIDCRFNKSALAKRIEYMATEWSGKVRVVFGDALDVLNGAAQADDKVYYVDPPYYAQGRKLYRFHYELADHSKLANVLSNLKAPWILSYDNHHVIEHLYAGCTKFRIGAQYMVKSRKTIDELMVTNLKDVSPLLANTQCGYIAPMESITARASV